MDSHGAAEAPHLRYICQYPTRGQLRESRNGTWSDGVRDRRPGQAIHFCDREGTNVGDNPLPIYGRLSPQTAAQCNGPRNLRIPDTKERKVKVVTDKCDHMTKSTAIFLSCYKVPSGCRRICFGNCQGIRLG